MGKKNNLEVFLSSETGKKFFNMFYSWGAAIVIIGAMFKIIHLPYADIVLMVGMITEALVFFIAGLDNSSDDEPAQVSTSSGVILGGATVGGTISSPVGGSAATGINTEEQTGKNIGTKGGGGSVVVVGGSGNVQQSAGGNFVAGGSTMPSAGSTGTSSGNYVPSASGNVQSGKIEPSQGTAQIQGGASPEAAQNVADFSNTIQSLNEAAQKLLGTHGFVENLTELNKNVSGLNEVFSTQLETIKEQMSAIRYINDSLGRMKNLYDGAIGDSYMFKEESAKMTKHIEALNNVYARLLQAMTSNNNPNMPKY